MDMSEFSDFERKHESMEFYMKRVRQAEAIAWALLAGAIVFYALKQAGVYFV